MIKVNKANVEMSGSPLELAKEIAIAARALAATLGKTNIPTEPVKKALLGAIEAAFEDDFESDKEEIEVKEEEADSLDKVADLLAELMRKLDERRGDTKNG